MGRKLDLKGERFGRLIALKEAGKTKQGSIKWQCKCDCGKIIYVCGAQLKNGNTKSCGCLQRDTVRKLNSQTKFVHGESNTRLHRIWSGMVQRTTDTRSKDYPRYGGRGIAVCSEWLTYTLFRDWALSNGYKDNLTIERTDNDLGYNPDNCVWATYKQQNRNRSTIKLNERSVGFIKRYLRDTKMTNIDIGKLFGVSHGTISAIKRGRIWTDVQPIGDQQ